MKGVILAGGTGSRLNPLTKVMNKHLLPVGRYPMIFWPILKLKEAGIHEILIVTNKQHLVLFKKLLGQGEDLNVSLHYQIQEKQGGGAADALMTASHFTKGEKFVALLGDNIFEDSLIPFVNAFQHQGPGARVLLKEVQDPSPYGVAQIDRNLNQIVTIKEKPQNPLSSYCVTGIYMYDHKVFQFIQSLRPSWRNELEITDVNNLYINHNQLQFDFLKGWWIDAGTHESLFQANQLVYKAGEGG